ncbi:MAG: hypothetical protein JW891_02485 [Candidatus Lokiarchaeota archaeon]|nr:hypothetical protein [Candidatus Lokiarchaeota archaeon]
MTDDNYIPLRKFFNESLLKDLALFSLLFFLILSQEWQDIILVVFPLITFTISLFFRFVGSNKWKLSKTVDFAITYSPFGSEIKHASRLFYCTIIQLILLFWIGAESLYRPQLLDSFSLVFTGAFSFAYSFGFYWIFLDLWKHGKIAVVTRKSFQNNLNISFKEDGKDVETVLRALKVKKFKSVSLGSLLILFLLNFLNLMFLLASLGGKNQLGIKTSLPGTVAGVSGSIIIPYSTIICLIVSPAAAIIFLISIYKDIKMLKDKVLDKVLSSLPDSFREEIKREIQSIQNKSYDIDI